MTSNKRPRGDVRKLLVVLGKIQDLSGQAIGIATNDRNPMLMDDLMPRLHEIFHLCVEARSLYPPLD